MASMTAKGLRNHLNMLLLAEDWTIWMTICLNPWICNDTKNLFIPLRECLGITSKNHYQRGKFSLYRMISVYDFRIINEEVMIKLKDHYSISLNELTHDHQWLPALQKERRLDITFLLVEVHITICKVVLPKWTLNMFNPSDWTTNFQEIRRTKEQVTIHNTDTIQFIIGKLYDKGLSFLNKYK